MDNSNSKNITNKRKKELLESKSKAKVKSKTQVKKTTTSSTPVKPVSVRRTAARQQTAMKMQEKKREKREKELLAKSKESSPKLQYTPIVAGEEKRIEPAPKKEIATPTRRTTSRSVAAASIVKEEKKIPTRIEREEISEVYDEPKREKVRSEKTRPEKVRTRKSSNSGTLSPILISANIIAFLLLALIIYFGMIKSNNKPVSFYTVPEIKLSKIQALSTTLEASEAEDTSITSITQLSEGDSNGEIFDIQKQSQYPYYITINVSQNCVTVYGKDSDGKYTVPVRAMICSTGTHTPAPGSSYTVKYKWQWLGLFNDVYGRYVTQINGNILFHSVPYTEKNNNGSLEYWEYDKLGTKASLGCIRLQLKDAKWIYDNVAKGSIVEFYSDNNPGPLGKPSISPISGNEANRNWDPTDTDPNSPWNKDKEAKAAEASYSNKNNNSNSGSSSSSSSNRPSSSGSSTTTPDDNQEQNTTENETTDSNVVDNTTTGNDDTNTTTGDDNTNTTTGDDGETNTSTGDDSGNTTTGGDSGENTSSGETGGNTTGGDNTGGNTSGGSGDSGSTPSDGGSTEDNGAGSSETNP